MESFVYASGSRMDDFIRLLLSLNNSIGFILKIKNFLMMLGFIDINIFFFRMPKYMLAIFIVQAVRNSSLLSRDHGHDSAILERELALFSFWQLQRVSQLSQVCLSSHAEIRLASCSYEVQFAYIGLHSSSFTNG
jgi:hypothetical protein